MEKFENYHHPERHYTHGPGAKWIDKPVVGFGCPYSDRKTGSLRYTLGYRGYDLEVSRDISVWQVGIYPTQPDLPILRLIGHDSPPLLVRDCEHLSRPFIARTQTTQ